MIRLPPRSTRMTHSFPTRLSSDLYSRYRRTENQSSTSFMSLRSTGASTPDNSCPRLSTAPASPISAHMPWRCRSRSEEHTSELQSLMSISYAVFCLKKKIQTTNRKNKQRTQDQRDNRAKQY